jgi:trans-aconitate 2-methyltransferase
LKPRGSIASFPNALARELDDARAGSSRRAEEGEAFVPLADTWDANLFLRFEAERARPARDLVARIESSPRIAVDLGCGPGSSTRLLAERFPDARVVGIDSSARMLAEARRRLPGVEFEQVDITQWRPEQPPDLIFANGALEWVPDHEALFPRLIAQLSEGGTLAVQMPDTTQEPTHALMRLIAADGPWSDRLVPIAKTRAVIAPYTDYYNWLRPHAASLDIWQTTYVHPLASVDAVVDWFRGSALRPFLAPLSPDEQDEFLGRYRRELAESYGVEMDGRVLFLYPGLFILARKP